MNGDCLNEGIEKLKKSGILDAFQCKFLLFLFGFLLARFFGKII
jgi:hypothetical protein